MRKELAPHERAVIGVRALGARRARWRGGSRAPSASPAPPFDWRIVERPAYANQIGTLTLDGERAAVDVEAVVDGSWREPRLQTPSRAR